MCGAGALARGLADPVGNLGDFQDGVHFGANTLQFAGFVQGRYPVA